ncbi:hypothetical protein ZWY2020_009837 [Hordeum vulgare]|nr:hypothetical protein ZWY2020_009837 [Hordeum vulgare]
MSSGSDIDGVASGGVWPSCLTIDQTEDLARFGLYVPPSAKLPRPWRISADGYLNLGPPASREELWRHPSGRYNRKGRHHFWTEKSFDTVVGAFRHAAHGVPVGDIPWEGDPYHRRVAAPAAPAAAPAAPPSTPEVPLPLEQASLHQDGKPADTRGLLAALAKSVEETARAAAEEALDEKQAMALEATAEEDDWLLSSDDNGDDDGDDDCGGRPHEE